RHRIVPERDRLLPGSELRHRRQIDKLGLIKGCLKPVPEGNRVLLVKIARVLDTLQLDYRELPLPSEIGQPLARVFHEVLATSIRILHEIDLWYGTDVSQRERLPHGLCAGHAQRGKAIQP